ncbi:hypothetical protein FW774_05860 [Pedobacter sp. BS3]|uniref:DUF6712 family protein n=1 Tax=Pedobacter sp. BS3 TaxID=2567937 RepID=UPI0011EE2001|nr:hypothetical protein [Pedobacter sp. BS3]TZF84512.1 hypothetical protein FW774_05860 [Pedobacter sp. BS3]
MDKLITIEDFEGYRNITRNLNDITKLDPHIREAQDFDLKPVIGAGLLYDFLTKVNEYRGALAADPEYVATADQQKYLDLLYGKDYQQDGYTIHFEGCRAFLVYASYARYLPEANLASTEYGLRYKKDEYSENIDKASRAELVAKAKEGARVYESDMIDFLNANLDSYPLFRSSCKCVHKKDYSAVKGNVRINAIGR